MKTAFKAKTHNSAVAPSTMKAATLVAPGRIEVLHVPVPDVGPQQVRVGITGCGVCASNLPPWEGRPWFTYPFQPGQLGHEGWGYVDQVSPDVKGISEGDYVAFLSERSYAQYDIAPASKVVVLPPPLHGLPFPGEPLGCAMNILRRANIQPGQKVAIIGIGFLGALLCRLISQSGASVTAISRRRSSLDVAIRMGAEQVIPMDDHCKIIGTVKGLTAGEMFPIVIEAVGMQWPLDLAAELTAIRGRMVIAGYHQDGARQVNMQLWNWRGLDVINAHERDADVYMQGIQQAVQAALAGNIEVQPLLTHQYPLEHLADALTATQRREGQFMKAVITM